MKFINIIVLISMIFLLAGCCEKEPDPVLRSVDVGIVVSNNENQFNNSLVTENITFRGVENITRYLSLHKTSKIKEAYINFSGYVYIGGVDDDEFENSSVGWSNPASCYDNDWDSQTSPGNVPALLWINYTTYSSTDANLTVKFQQYCGTDSQYYDQVLGVVACYNTSEDWEWFVFHNFADSSVKFNDSVIPQTCLQESITQLLFNYSDWGSIGNSWCNGHCYESNVTYFIEGYIEDPYLEVGTPDGTYEWNVTDQFNVTANKTLNFNTSLNNAINDGACDCDGCLLVEDNCTIPFLFTSEAPGTIEYSVINISSERDVDRVNLTLYLDGKPFERKYEWGTTANISAESNDSSVEFCIDFNAPKYGDDYVCGYSNIEFNYTVSYALKSEFNDTMTSKMFNFTTVKFSYLDYVNLSNSEINVAQWNISGSENALGYPENITIDVLNNGSIDFMSTGLLNGSKLQNNQFTNKLDSENLIYAGQGSKQRYLNYSVNDVDLFVPYDITFNLTGGKAMEEGINFKDLFWNSTNINLTASNVTHEWVWEDFSLGDIAGRWTGAYTVTTDTKIEISSSCSCAGVGDCVSGSNTDSDSDQFYSQTLDLGTYNAIFLNVYLYGNGNYAANPCNEVAEGSGTATFSIRNKNTGISTTVKSISASDGGVGSSSSTTDSDSSLWEIRRFGDNLKFYDDGVYEDEMDYNSEHQYEVKINTGCGCGSRQYSAAGSGTGRITSLNASGITGTKVGDFTWTNSTIDSLNIMNFSTNVTAATLTATTSIPTDTSIIFYMGTSNNTAWEEVQSGVGHEFTMDGTNLSWRANITTTDAQDANGDQTEIPIIYDVQIEVSSGYPENITVDFGYDGVVDWNMTGDINETESEIVTINLSVINNYIYQNCEDDLTCKIPVSIYSATGGLLAYGDLSADLEINGINLDAEIIEDYLSGCSGSCNVTFNITADAGNITIDDLGFEYIGEENYTVFAHLSEDNVNNDTLYLVTRYSPINVSYPLHVPGFFLNNVYNLTQYNITPFGQEINYCNQNNYTKGYCENNSVPIWNISSLAKTDPVEVYLKLNQTFECVNITVDDDLNLTGGIVLTNITGNQSLIIAALGVGSTQGVWSWSDMFDCNRTKLAYFDVEFYFDTLCEGCVHTADAFTD